MITEVHCTYGQSETTLRIAMRRAMSHANRTDADIEKADLQFLAAPTYDAKIEIVERNGVKVERGK